MDTAATASEPDLQNEGTVSLREKIAYGLGNFGTQMVFNPATTFMVFFYTDVVGIAAVTVGNILFLSRFLDVLNPVMGVVVDRTHTKRGKARPWLLWMAIPFGIAASLLFSSPTLGPTARIVYAFVTYNLAFTIVYTAVDIPYSSLLPLITTKPNERTVLSVTRMILSNAGIVISFAVTMPLVKALGDGRQGWQRAFLIFGAIATLSIFACYAGTRERVTASGHGAQSVPLKEGVTAILKNKYLLLLAALAGTLFLLLGLLVANLYYCRYFLHKAELFGPLMTMMVHCSDHGHVLHSRNCQTARKAKHRAGGIGGNHWRPVAALRKPANFHHARGWDHYQGFGRGPVDRHDVCDVRRYHRLQRMAMRIPD